MLHFVRFRNPQFLRVLLFLGASQFLVAAETTVLHLYEAPDPDPILEEVLYLAAGTGLREAGFSSTRSGETADYTLVTAYTAAGGAVEIKQALYQPGEPRQELSRTAYSLPLNYDFDTRVAGEIHRLIEEARLSPGSPEEAEIEGLFPAGPDSGSAGAAAGPEGSAGAAGEGLGDAENDSGASVPAPEGGRDGSLERRREKVPAVFGLSAAVSGLMLFGPITEYFHYGGAGKISAGLSWPGKALGFSLGIEGGGTRIFNDEGVAGGPLYISTAGAFFALGTGSQAPYRIAGTLSGGAAIITVTGGEGVLSKTVPYGEAGIRTLFPLGRGYSLGGEMSFKMIFDHGLTIYGASPAFMMRKEF